MHISENRIVSDQLERAVVVEYDGTISATEAVSLAWESNVSVACISALSPFKLIFFFDTVDEM